MIAFGVSSLYPCFFTEFRLHSSALLVRSAVPFVRLSACFARGGEHVANGSRFHRPATARVGRGSIPHAFDCALCTWRSTNITRRTVQSPCRTPHAILVCAVHAGGQPTSNVSWFHRPATLGVGRGRQQRGCCCPPIHDRARHHLIRRPGQPAVGPQAHVRRGRRVSRRPGG